MRIIDEHRHIGLSGSRGNPSINDIIFQLDTFDIDHAILAPGDCPRQDFRTYEAEAAETDNIYETVKEYLTTGILTPNIITLQQGEPYHNEVLNAARATDGRLLGCWLLNPHLGEIEFNKVRSAVLDEGFRYIKLHPPHHAFAADNLQLLDPVMTLARQLDVPVWIHSSSGPGTEVTQLARLAAGFPDVNIIMGHVFIQEILPERENIPIVVAAANSHHNLWVDLSHAGFISIKAILDQGSQDRILFGSDDPWNGAENTMETMLHNIRSAAGTNKILLEKVLGANASELFKIK